MIIFFYFFFSSRRRHTRYWRDWSSDVCSSDLRGVEAEPHEATDRERIGRAPGNPALGVEPFEVAEQQQPKVPPRRQPGAPHHRRVERLTLFLGEPVEAGFVEDGVQPRVERMAGRDGERGGRNPDRRLLARAFAHRHGSQFTVSPALLAMDLSPTFTTGC